MHRILGLLVLTSQSSGQNLKHKKGNQTVKKENLIDAVDEAKRFLDRAKPLLKLDETTIDWKFGGKAFAAARRSSLDLTRSLAKLRQQR
jgi:hypothetical protein